MREKGRKEVRMEERKRKRKKYRKERRKEKNKAGYTATLVACGWAGAVIELLEHLGKSGEAKDRKNIKKVKWGPTDRPTDGRTKPLIEYNFGIFQPIWLKFGMESLNGRTQHM